jgi:uncharacterized protein YggE
MLRCAAVTVLTAVFAAAQPPPGPPSVRTTAEVIVSAKPDQAKIDIGVVTQAQTAQSAASQNAAQLQTVMDRLRSALGGKGDVRTVNYALNPNYQYPRDGGKPTITGYSAVNSVQVTIDDLSVVGKAIDAATQGGANEIQRLQFTLKDERAARAQALRQAAMDARASAEAMAGALGMKLGRVLLLEQGAIEAPPIRPMMARTAAVGVPTPIESGQIEVRASVTLTIAIE